MLAITVPLLKKLKKNGSFYTLSTTLNDFNSLFSGSQLKLVPSKFAVLKLPKWQNTTEQRIFRNPSDFGTPTVTDPNILLPKYIQDYLEVFNSYAPTNRNDSNLLNTSEIAFWKMLRDAGALKFKEDITYTENGKVRTRYIEEPESDTYDPVIKYIGDVNLLNHQSKDGQSYTELYMHLPTDSGKIDRISFTQNDVKWNLPEFPEDGGSELAPGLEAHEATGNVKAIYDTPDRKYKVSESIDNNTLYFNDIETNINDSYKKGNYEFNAIALYYDVWNENDQTSVARNLYGIFFIDEFIPSTGGSYELGKFEKIQPSDENAGNSYGFRINLKFSNSTNQVSSEISINDYNTISMELYMEALKLLTVTNWNYQKIVNVNTQLVNRIATLESNFSSFIPLEETTSELKAIRDILKTLDTNDRVFAPTQEFSTVEPKKGIYIEGSTYWDITTKKIYQWVNGDWVFKTNF